MEVTLGVNMSRWAWVERCVGDEMPEVRSGNGVMNLNNVLADYEQTTWRCATIPENRAKRFPATLLANKQGYL